MSDQDLTSGVHVTYPPARASKQYVAEQVIDCTEKPLTQNDIAKMIDVPANSFVEKVHWAVETVEGSAVNFEIGDGADPDGYVAATSANSVESGISDLALTEGAPNTVTGYTAGKLYKTADTIDLKAPDAGGLSAAKIRVRAIITDLN